MLSFCENLTFVTIAYLFTKYTFESLKIQVGSILPTNLQNKFMSIFSATIIFTPKTTEDVSL